MHAGHEVFSPSLAGLGERSFLLSSEIGLETHIQEIAELLRFEDLHDVVLVGHSYGGMVVTGACDLAGDHVRHLVYLDALVPQDGQSNLDLMDKPVADLFRQADRRLESRSAGRCALALLRYQERRRSRVV